MGSLDKYCRLCALNVRPDQLLQLFEDDPSRSETPNGAKLRNFLSFNIRPEDRLPKQVCAQCISNLDYCIQFVDKSRRIESLLQRGLDVDYVASEVDYRYTYLFPSPYPSQDNRPAYPEFPDTGGAFFGTSQSPPATSHRNSENIGLNLSQIPDRIHSQNVQNNQESQFSPNDSNTYQPARLEAPTETKSTPTRHHSTTNEENSTNNRTTENNNNPSAASHPILQRTQSTVLPASTSSVTPTVSAHTTALAANKSQHGEQKVAMYRNDVSVDNMVVEIEPNDLFPRKAGNVKQEYPWKVGGATKRSLAMKERKTEPEKKPEKESPPKKMRSILPKFEAPQKPLAASGTKSVNQIMIPVTLKTPCKSCNKLIVASSLSDLKNHVCENEDRSLECIVTNCNKKFANKNGLRYHQKHCHNILANPSPVKKDIDIMSIATNELVGCTDAAKSNVSYQMLENSSYASNQSTPAQTVGLTYQQSFPAENSHSNQTNQHNPTIAAPKKVYACPYEGCSKSYNAKNYLVQHERLHTGERPYSCTNCGKGFSRVLDMKKHNLLKVCY